MKGIKEILEAGKGLTESVGKAFDQNFTSQEEKLQARNDLLQKANEIVTMTSNLQSNLIKSEAEGNFLQRSWRPLVMLSFAFIVIYAYFVQPAFFPDTRPIADILDPRFWDLLQIGLGGYVIGRSAEKVVKSVAENMDISVNRNKKS
jgi:hypothetical protein